MILQVFISPVNGEYDIPEVTAIRSMAPINLIVYCPKTAAGREELARRVSDVHAASVIRRIQALNCPTRQKLELLDAVIAAAKQHSREPEG